MAKKRNDLAQAARVAYFEASGVTPRTLAYVRRSMDSESSHIWTAVAEAVRNVLAEKILTEARRTDNLAEAKNDSSLKNQAEGLFAAAQIANKAIGEK